MGVLWLMPCIFIVVFVWFERNAFCSGSALVLMFIRILLLFVCGQGAAKMCAMQTYGRDWLTAASLLPLFSVRYVHLLPV